MTTQVDRSTLVMMNNKMKQGGFLVDVTFKKAGNQITLSPQLLGLNVDENEGLKEFFNDFMDNNRVNFLKKSVVKKADAVAKAVHKEKRVQSLGESGNFMTKEILRDFRAYLDRKKLEYFAARDEIVAHYDEYVAEFKEEFEQKFISVTLSSISEAERNVLMEKVFRRIPTKQQYADSFAVGLKRMSISLADEVDDEDVDEVLMDTLSQVNEITGKNLSIAFTGLNRLMDAYHKNGSLNNRNRAVLTSVPRELERRNLFNDAIVEEARQKVIYFKSTGLSDDEIIEESEMLVSKIFAYATEIGTEEQLDLNASVLSVDEMQEINDIFAVEEEVESLA